MVVCENCRKREATAGCLICRRNLCNECYEEHMERISADMDEGFAGFENEVPLNDQSIVCEVCGAEVESEKKDEHMFEAHGITI